MKRMERLQPWELQVETVIEWLREYAETVDIEVVWDMTRNELFRRHLKGLG